MDAVRYLRRIGYDGPLDADHRTLAALQRAHLLTVPFDALDCHLGNAVTVVPGDAYRKVVEAGRGGFCFELNGLFAWLLEELGFEVMLLAARPVIRDGGLAPPFAHLALLVDTGRRWLVDVGFGFPFALEPLDVDREDEQVRGGRRFRVAQNGDTLLAQEIDATPPRAYRFTLTPMSRASFAERCRTSSTDPASVFVRQGPVLQLFADGWVSVTRNEVFGQRGATRLDRAITNDADWRAELQRHFGLVVRGSEVRGANGTADTPENYRATTGPFD